MSNLHKNSKYTIAVAKLEHLDDIFKLAQLYALSDFESPELASERGFLVSNFSRQTYENFIQENHVFWILEESGELRAFLLAIASVKRILDKALDAKIKEYGISKYMLVKQICTHPGHTSKGLASYLYRAFIEKHNHIPLVTAIVTDPPNPRSIALHKKLGFKSAFKYTAPDGLPRSIWIRARGKGIKSK